MHNLKNEQIILGITQGISELLPISSSMHLLATPKITNYLFGEAYNFSKYNNISAEIMAHFGSLFVLLVFFRNNVAKDISLLYNRNQKFFSTFAFYSAVTTICTSVMILLFHDTTTHLLSGHNIYRVMSASNVISALLLYLADKNTITSGRITFLKACIVGIVQFFASISGVSRLGITITTCRLLDISRAKSVSFSMFCAIPTICGAIAYDVAKNGINLNICHEMGIVCLSTILTGLLCVKYCYKALIHYGFLWILIYRIFMSIIILQCK